MRHQRLDILRARSLRCPQCGETWLVFGVREGDRHICKACGEESAVPLKVTKEGGRDAA